MTTGSANHQPLLSLVDEEELTKLVNAVALSDHSLTLFAVAPESAPDHPVVQQFNTQLGELDEPLQFLTFFYSDNSLFKFLTELDSQSPPSSGRRVILAFGLEQLPIPRLQQAMDDLNLGREAIFERNLVLVFWLNRESFLDEFRRRAPDFWDWRGKVATFETHPPLNPLFYPYLEWLIAENSYLKMSGVMQVNRQVDIVLDQIYVSLQAEWVEERSQSFRERITTGEGQVRSSRASLNKLGEPDALAVGLKTEPMLPEVSSEPVSRQRVTKNVDLAEAVRKQDFSVILGDPGAGKTTLLRYLARHFAIANRDGNPSVLGGMQEDLGQTQLPILFRIADYAERLAQQPDLSLVDYLKQFYRQWERYFQSSDGDAVANLLLEKMRTGDCLLLLDGLDEVFDQSSRVQVVQQINQLVDAYRTNKFVITSRIAGYQEAALGNRFREFTITPMGNSQIQKFLERWCLAIEVAQRPDADNSLHQRDAEREAQGIFHAIETKPGVKRFATNPLLLTILALIHRNGTQLPQRRVELYALATKTLIEDWQLGRNIPYGARKRQLVLVEEEVTALLAPLAFRMHEEKPSGLVTQAEVENWLTPKMAELQGVDEPAALELIRQFLRKVREGTGLFVERAPAVYGFMHLTFEEYFAARHIADNEIDDILRIISPYRNQARWNEPILLALGYLSADQNRVNRLVEQLFSNLAAYQPVIVGQEIRLKNASADRPVLVWYSQPESKVQESDSVWQDLLFVGQVLAEMKVTPRFCRQQVEKLVLTYLALDTDFDDEPIQQLLKLLWGIETFNHQVLERLQQAAEDESLSEEQHNRALVAMLYLACGEAGETLTDCVTAIVQQLTPSLFNEIRDLVEELGAEMTPALERSLEDTSLDVKRRQALEFMTGLSYLRAEQYDRAIAQLQPLVDQADCRLDGFIRWTIAIAYEKKDDYDQGLQYYQQCSEKLQSFILLCNWGVCHRSHKQYEQSLECFQQALGISRQSNNRKAEANILFNIGRSDQDWGKCEEAITYYEQSRELYQHLGKPTDVANQWYWIGDCYRQWGKYEKALEAEQQELTLRQKLDEQSNIALVYWRLGYIYQAWGKYAEAIAHYQQSRELYQQLGREKEVSYRCSNLAECYKEWGKYEQAIEYAQQCLKLCKNLEEQLGIAVTYSQLGSIYRAWGKYEQAIAHHQQSRDLYLQLGKETDVANQWYWIGDCYRDWGKYQQALEAEQQELALRQKLDEQSNLALAYWQLGRIYQAWGKYEQAIAHHEQSRDLYLQLGKETDVADLWYWIGDCYRDWGKYQQALEAEQQELALRQKLDEQSNIARAYWRLGRIYQAWGKYEQAIAHHEQSRDLYLQLGKETNVADLWYWIGDCYRDWGKYQQALEAEQQELALRQKLDEQENIALAYWRLGSIYQAWGKYEQAIAHHEQSRDLNQQLGKETNVADLWYWIGDCYRDWGKYQQALEAEQQELSIRQKLDEQENIALAYWRLGSIYQAWGKYEQAIAHYAQSRDLLQQLGKETDVANQWYWLANCYREWGKYQQALEAEQQELTLRQKLDEQENIARAYWQLGRIYQAWGKYEQAIAHHAQSRDLLQQLGKETDVANQWYWLANCYREWGKYQQALEAEQQELTLRQKLDEQENIALAYWRLGRIYQAWGKYEQAIAHHAQSRDLYQQLSKETNVATQWYWLAVCYREWSKYEQALEAKQQELTLRQKLDEQSNIADAYFQLGRIYQAWGKYKQAIAHYEQSRDLYQQLSRETNVANQWYWIGDCYREWGKYEQALEVEQQELTLRQKLDEQSNIADAYFQLGRIYQAWGKYEQAIAHYQQSRELLQQLGKETDVADLWYSITDCYREWSKYQQALEVEQQELALRQRLDEQVNIAHTYYQLGRIYQDWGKYREALAHYERSRDLCESLDLQQIVAHQLSWLAACYRESKDYTTAIKYYQNSIERYQALGHNESAAIGLRQLSNTQQQLAKNCSREEATALLQQAEHHLQQAIQLDTAGDYRENLAYDHIALALLFAEHLRWLPENDASIPNCIAQFEQSYTTGFAYFTELGQAVDSAEQALDIARAYLEISPLENLDRAEELAHQSLQTFQEFNRPKLEASACKLLGEIYLARARRQESGAIVSASQFLNSSLHRYRELDLTEKAAEVEQLMSDEGIAIQQ